MSTKCFKCVTKKSQSGIQVAHTFCDQISSHFFKKTTTNASLRLYQIVICRKKRQKKKHAQPTPQPPTPGCRSVRSRPTLSPSHPVLSALRPRSRFPNTIRFGSRPPLIRMSAPAHKQSLLVRHVVSMLSHQVISRAQLYFALSLPDLPGAVNFFNSCCLSLLPGCFPAGAGPSPEEVKRG